VSTGFVRFVLVSANLPGGFSKEFQAAD